MVTICFPRLSWESSLTGDCESYGEIRKNEKTIGSGNRAALSIGAPLGVHGGRLLHQGLLEKGEILFYQETMFIWDSGRYVKEGSGNEHLSPWGPIRGTWKEVHLPGTLRNR